jgi:DMSO/TMAO reductase YedYZ heme-binding membrane subunit
MTRLFTGWRMVGVVAIGLALLVAMIVATVPGEVNALRTIIRATARSSVALFLLAFTASAAFLFWPGAFTRWQRSNRRYLGVSFALSHFVHLGAILVLRATAPEEMTGTPTATWVLGGVAYVLIAAMTATSFDRAAQALGRRAWSILHTTGVYYVWIVFANSYVSRAVMMPEYIVPALAVVAALALRVAAFLRRRASSRLSTSGIMSG